MIPTLHPLADVARRYRQMSYGQEAEMTTEEARQYRAPAGTKLWWEVNNHASALYLTGHTNEALIVVKSALAMKRAVPTLVNITVILETMGRFTEALPYAEEACRIDPSDDRASALLAESYLRMGRMAEGWPLYVKNRASMDWCQHFVPEWLGPHQSLKGKRILIIEGGGYGDNIYFLRWLATLRWWGAHIHYVCQPSFAPLARRLGYHAIENWQGNADIHWREYDYYCPLLSLAAKLGVTLENYRWTGPYIPGHKRACKGLVGLCWRAGEGKSPRKQRSLNDVQLKWMIDSLPERYQWVNLTHAHHRHEMLEPHLDNWLDTAREVGKLELLISADTGVAHLGGAMGINTIVMLPGAGAWQYPLGHEYHPLYPSMRITRSKDEGLEGAVAAAVHTLRHL